MVQEGPNGNEPASRPVQSCVAGFLPFKFPYCEASSFLHHSHSIVAGDRICKGGRRESKQVLEQRNTKTEMEVAYRPFQFTQLFSPMSHKSWAQEAKCNIFNPIIM